LQKRQDTNTSTKSKSKTKVAKPKGKGTTVKKGKAAVVATKKKITTLSGDDLGSDLTDLDDQGIEDDDDDGRSVQFPTFVSASALSTSTTSEDSDTDSLSNFDSDSSMEAEEENYILSEERRHEKVRVRKELLGEDGYKRKDPLNNWVIRPRKQSVGGSDVDMDVDSDATEDEDDEEEEGEDGGDEDELDDSNPGVTYAGVGTGWSDEDDESSFDADLFFANLSDSTADGQSTCTEDDQERDHPNWDEETTGSAIHAARLQMDNLPFEVSQGWDGQIVFTNGLGEGQGILDLDFEVSAAQLVEDSASPSQDSDVEMQTPECDEEYEEAGEYGEEEESDGGDTTDDDYVDKDGLPTKRMLELFRWPSSLSAIDPMSTVSPTVSPHPRSRRRTQGSVDSRSPRDSPRPADILAGKTFWDEHEDLDRGDVAASVASSSRGPLMGTFEAGQDHPRRAILTGSNDEIPSPFPRLKHRKKASSLSSGVCYFLFLGFGADINILPQLDQSRGRAPSRPHSLSVSTTSSTLQGLSSEGQASQVSLDHPTAEAIDLHDVLDVSFLDNDAADPLTLSSTSASEGEVSRTHLHSMNRWSHVPMGTFRRTRESGVILGDGASTSWQAQTPRVSAADGFAQGSSRMLKSSPFSEITWHSRGSNPPKGTRRPSKTFKNIIISPVILPVRDGDRTPTNIPPHIPQREQTQHKSRKELRRETKMKRKSYGPVHHQHQHHQRQHFQHNHHPNSKSRSSSSMQRTNFFNSPTGAVPPLNL